MSGLRTKNSCMSPKEKVVCFYLIDTGSCARKQVSLFALAAGSLIAKYVERKFSFVDHYVPWGFFCIVPGSALSLLCFFRSYLVLS